MIDKNIRAMAGGATAFMTPGTLPALAMLTMRIIFFRKQLKEVPAMMRVSALVGTALAVVLSTWLAAHASGDETVIELWDTVKAPPPPEVKPVTVDPATCALLVLDIEQRTCNAEARPRCVALVPAIAAFLHRARAKGMAVVYSVTTVGTPETILDPVKPGQGEPVVKSSVDKFHNTELEKVLKDRGIRTVIIAGTAPPRARCSTPPPALPCGDSRSSCPWTA
jgi:hypothetical protein